jgi:glycosyltransferase involved in cell wall biosynthesis
MKITFVHHHLRPGGVTRVIGEQVEAIKDVHQALVVVGEKSPSKTSFPVAVIPSIGYDRDRNDVRTAAESAKAILGAARAHWGSDAGLYHVHNPTLGKNRDFLGVLRELQVRGARLLLQIHDFAEDGRPQNYTGEPYPEDCHYAVINSRDLRILQWAGLKEEGVHLIPNAVKPPPQGDRETAGLGIQAGDGVAVAGGIPAGVGLAGGDLLLYPVRAIRRKNIGEAVLLSLFLPEGVEVGITLEPTGALDVRSYRAWMDFVSRERLPVRFRLGVTGAFERVLGRARCILTTSIKEGFGLAFLESWMGGRPLVGRLLPDICGDFVDAGLELGHLYTKLSVPLQYVDSGRFFTLWRRCFTERLARYGLEAGSDAEGFEEGIRSAGSVDFGMLNEELQRQVINCLLGPGAPAAKDELLRLNPGLDTIATAERVRDLIPRNRAVVSRVYSVERNRERLLETYERVCSVTPTHSIRRDALLRAFNRPEAGHLLLCEQSYAE